MNKRQVVVLWIIAIVLSVAAFLARSSNSEGFESETERARGQTLIADFPAAQVAKIQLTSGEDATTIVRKDGNWSVENRDGYPANIRVVNEFLRTLAEVEVTQGIESKPTFAPRFGMDPDAKEDSDRGIEIVLSDDAGSELGHITLGRILEAGGDPMAMMGGGASGRFIRNHDDESGFYVVSEIFPSVSPEPRIWLKDDFVKIEKIKSIAVSPKAKLKEIDWKVSRADESADFTLEGAKEGESLETAQNTSLKSLLSYSRFADVVPDDKIDDLANPVEKRNIKIETLEGFTYDIGLTAVHADQEEASAAGNGTPERTFLMTIDTTAEIPAERKKDEKETEEDAKTKDEAFAKRKDELEQRLAADKKLAGITYRVDLGTVEPLTKDRAQIIAAPAAAPAASTLPAPGAPGAARRPIQAVTPPISIPPREPAGE